MNYLKNKVIYSQYVIKEGERTPLNNRLYVFLFPMIKNHITNATRYEKYKKIYNINIK